MKKQVKRIIGIFGAMNGVGIGVALFLQCQLGSDPIGLLCNGIQCAFHMEFRYASILYNLIVIVLALCITRNGLGLGTVVYALLSGYFIDFYYYLLNPLALGQAEIWIRLVGYCIGQILMTLGLAMLIHFQLGMNALDAILYKLSECLHIPYTFLRVGTDVLYSVMGTLLGGIYGIGTLVCILSTGIFVTFHIKLFMKVESIWDYKNFCCFNSEEV